MRREGVFFECVTHGVYAPGTVVEMVNVGPAHWRWDEERERIPYIWARSADEARRTFWFFRSADLKPLTKEAARAHEHLVALEKAAVERRYAEYVRR